MSTLVWRPVRLKLYHSANESWAASFYSYVAFLLIEKDRESLAAHGVEVE